MRAAVFAAQTPAPHRVATALANFSFSSGIASFLRRRWPIGYSTSIRSVELPSAKKIWIALAIERFSGSR